MKATKEITAIYKEMKDQQLRLWLACSRYNTAVANKNELDTPESYKEVAEALNAWDEQDKKLSQLGLNYQYSHRIVFKG